MISSTDARIEIFEASLNITGDDKNEIFNDWMREFVVKTILSDKTEILEANRTQAVIVS